MASSSRVSSWRVTYATHPVAGDHRNFPFLDGVLVVRHTAKRISLLSAAERIIDSRALRDGEVIELGGAVSLPRHDVRIPVRPLSPGSLFQDGAGTEQEVGRRGPRAAMDFKVGSHTVPVGPPEFGILGKYPDGVATGPSNTSTAAAAPPTEEGNGISPASGEGYLHPGPDLEHLFRHFWEKPRVSPPPSRVSFGWWPGKVAGDLRSFAQVVTSPPRGSAKSRVEPMGDRGGARMGMRGGGGGRGVPAGGRTGAGGPGRGRNNVWQRNARDGSGQASPTGGVGQRAQADRWEAAAQGQVSNTTIAIQGNRPQNLQLPRNVRNDGRGDSDPCVNCNMNGHLAAHCPTIRCARCGRLGHISQICQVLLPWQCVAAMCGFQSPGQGFFYFPDSSTPQQVKEKASTVILTVVEGNVVARDIEKEFNGGNFFGQNWHCTARTLNPSQFSMRFPNPREVERACLWGNELKMTTKNAVLKLAPWSDDVGASSKLQKAWVRVRNIPSEKRNEAHAAYAGSLVGVTLDIDKSTIHRPEYVKILIGCRDVDLIPEKAEGCLGDNFYMFYYEVEQIVVGKQPNKNIMVHTDSNSGAPSPKRARNDSVSTYVSSEGQTEEQQQSAATSYGKSYAPGLETVSEHDSEDYSEEDNELLIDKIIRNKNEEEDKSGGKSDIEGLGKSVDNMASENPGTIAANVVHESSPCSPLIPTNGGMAVGTSENEKEGLAADPTLSENENDIPALGKATIQCQMNQAMVVHEGTKTSGTYAAVVAPGTPSLIKEQASPDSFPGQSLSYKIWPSLPCVVEVDDNSGSPAGDEAAYFVQSPDDSPTFKPEGSLMMDTEIGQGVEHPSLQPDDLKEQMTQGSEKLMRMAAEFTKKIKTGPARLTAGNGQ
ncbi:hypothetical protein ACQ4PT_062857 [Festuca glaucescens]